jgi:hypothetical protein
MFSSTSRYSKSDTSVLTTDSGKQITYINRRLLPPLPTTSYPSSNSLSADVENLTITVAAGDRLDNIAARTIGDPEQYWKICDVNDSMHPLDLTLTSGRIILISTSGGGLTLGMGGA